MPAIPSCPMRAKALVAFLETLTDPGLLLPPELVRPPEQVPSGLAPP